MGLDFELGLWRLHTVAIQIERPQKFHGQIFGLWVWPFEDSHYASQRLLFLNFIGYFQHVSLDSQQSLAIQSHDLPTWTAVV
jgi:hypothetical protein